MSFLKTRPEILNNVIPANEAVSQLSKQWILLFSSFRAWLSLPRTRYGGIHCFFKVLCYWMPDQSLPWTWSGVRNEVKIRAKALRLKGEGFRPGEWKNNPRSLPFLGLAFCAEPRRGTQVQPGKESKRHFFDSGFEPTACEIKGER